MLPLPACWNDPRAYFYLHKVYGYGTEAPTGFGLSITKFTHSFIAINIKYSEVI